MTSTTEQALAHDIELCELGMALTKGKRWAAYAKHRKACMAAIREMNVSDGLDRMTADELLAELLA